MLHTGYLLMRTRYLLTYSNVQKVKLVPFVHICHYIGVLTIKVKQFIWLDSSCIV